MSCDCLTPSVAQFLRPSPCSSARSTPRHWLHSLRSFSANAQAKKFVESVPQTLKENVPKEEAEKLQKKLQELGATVSMS